MNSLVSHINKILQQEDIEGLIEVGAPSDEYLSEAEAIALMVSNGVEMDAQNLENAIFAFWGNIFNLADNDMNLRRDAIHRVVIAIGERQT